MRNQNNYKLIIIIFLLFMTFTPKVFADNISVATIRDFVPMLTEIKETFEKDHTEHNINIINAKEHELLEILKQDETIIDIILLDDLNKLKNWGENKLIDTNHINKLGTDQLCIIVKKQIVMRPFMLYPGTVIQKGLIISNPAYTATGRYTKEALTTIKVWGKMAKKVLFFDNNYSIANEVSRGQYDGGITYCSFAQSSFVKITDILNPKTHSPIIFASAPALKENISEAALNFNKFLSSEKSKIILKKYHISLNN